MPQGMSWHQPSSHYTTDLNGGRGNSWDFSSSYLDATGGAGAAGAQQMTGGPQMRYERIPSISQSIGYNGFYMPGTADYQRSTQA